MGNQDPASASDPEVLDFALARHSPGASPFGTLTRPLIDAQGRVLVVDPRGRAAFSSAEFRPRITRLVQLVDGRFDLEFRGLPFGVFVLYSSTDLRDWGISSGVLVQLDHDGRGSMRIEAESGGELRRFWRGVYRPI